MWWALGIAYLAVALCVWVYLAFSWAESENGRNAVADAWGRGGHVYNGAVHEPTVYVGAVLWPLILPFVGFVAGVKQVILRIEKRRYESQYTLNEMARRAENDERAHRTSSYGQASGQTGWNNTFKLGV